MNKKYLAVGLILLGLGALIYFVFPEFANITLFENVQGNETFTVVLPLNIILLLAGSILGIIGLILKK